jgi:hypothetical protein
MATKCAVISDSADQLNPHFTVAWLAASMSPVFTIIGYMLFAAATFTGAVMAHSDWRLYAASTETAQTDKPTRKFAQVR